MTWEGGSIGPGEEGEFPFSFVVPEQPGSTIFFPTLRPTTTARRSGGSARPAPRSPRPASSSPSRPAAAEAPRPSPSRKRPPSRRPSPLSPSRRPRTRRRRLRPSRRPIATGRAGRSTCSCCCFSPRSRTRVLALPAQPGREPPVDDGGSAVVPPPVDPAGPQGSSSMPGGGQAPEPPGETGDRSRLASRRSGSIRPMRRRRSASIRTTRSSDRRTCERTPPTGRAGRWEARGNA